MISVRDLEKYVNSEFLGRHFKFQARQKVGYKRSKSVLRPFVLRRAKSLFPARRDGSTQGNVVQASYQEGIKQIHSRIAHKKAEHKWMFIPDYETWVDITIEGYSCEVFWDANLARFVASYFSADSVRLAHTHPTYAADNEFKQERAGLRTLYRAEGAFPSTKITTTSNGFKEYCGDLHMALKQRKFSFEVIDDIISHYGLTTVSLTDEGRAASEIEIDGKIKYCCDHTQKAKSAESQIRRVLKKMQSDMVTPEGDPAFFISFHKMQEPPAYIRDRCRA